MKLCSGVSNYKTSGKQSSDIMTTTLAWTLDYVKIETNSPTANLLTSDSSRTSAQHEYKTNYITQHSLRRTERQLIKKQINGASVSECAHSVVVRGFYRFKNEFISSLVHTASVCVSLWVCRSGAARAVFVQMPAISSLNPQVPPLWREEFLMSLQAPLTLRRGGLNSYYKCISLPAQPQ